jgi:hypothetical protein
MPQASAKSHTESVEWGGNSARLQESNLFPYNTYNTRIVKVVVVKSSLDALNNSNPPAESDGPSISV